MDSPSVQEKTLISVGLDDSYGPAVPRKWEARDIFADKGDLDWRGEQGEETAGLPASLLNVAAGGSINTSRFHLDVQFGAFDDAIAICLAAEVVHERVLSREAVERAALETMT